MVESSDISNWKAFSLLVLNNAVTRMSCLTPASQIGRLATPPIDAASVSFNALEFATVQLEAFPKTLSGRLV